MPPVRYVTTNFHSPIPATILADALDHPIIIYAPATSTVKKVDRTDNRVTVVRDDGKVVGEMRVQYEKVEVE